MPDHFHLFSALPLALGLASLALAANSLRLMVRFLRLSLAGQFGTGTGDDAFFNAGAAFLAFTLMLVAAA